MCATIVHPFYILPSSVRDFEGHMNGDHGNTLQAPSGFRCLCDRQITADNYRQVPSAWALSRSLGQPPPNKTTNGVCFTVALSIDRRVCAHALVYSRMKFTPFCVFTTSPFSVPRGGPRRHHRQQLGVTTHSRYPQSLAWHHVPGTFQSFSFLNQRETSSNASNGLSCGTWTVPIS